MPLSWQGPPRLSFAVTLSKQFASCGACFVQGIVNIVTKIIQANTICISIKPVGQSSKTGSVLAKASVLFSHRPEKKEREKKLNL